MEADVRHDLAERRGRAGADGPPRAHGRGHGLSPRRRTLARAGSAIESSGRESTGACPPGPPRNDPRPPPPLHHRPARALRRVARLSSPGNSSKTWSTARTSSGRGRSRWPWIRKSRARSPRSRRSPRSGRIEPDNLRAFHDVASRMLSLELGWQAVRLVDLESRVVVNTALPFGEPSTLVSDDWVRAIRDTKRPAVSAVQLDPAAKQHFVSIGVPVVLGGEPSLRARRPHPHERAQRRPAPATAAARRRHRADGRRPDDHGADPCRGRLRRPQAERRLPRRDPQRARRVAALGAARGHPVLLGLEHIRAHGLDDRPRPARRRRSTGRFGARSGCS